METVARMAPQATIGDVQRELDALTGRLATDFAATNRGWRTRAIALHDEVVGDVRSALYVVLAAVGLLLLIACINIASLLMARAASRAREVAVRAAIGATRERLVRQFLTESLVLATLGGALGVAVAYAAVRGIVAATPLDIPRLSDVGIDGRALGFALALVLTTAVTCSGFCRPSCCHASTCSACSRRVDGALAVTVAAARITSSSSPRLPSRSCCS